MPDMDYFSFMKRPLPSGVIRDPEWLFRQMADGVVGWVSLLTGEEILMPDMRSDYDKALDELNAEFPGMNKENMI